MSGERAAVKRGRPLPPPTESEPFSGAASAEGASSPQQLPLREVPGISPSRSTTPSRSFLASGLPVPLSSEPPRPRGRLSSSSIKNSAEEREILVRRLIAERPRLERYARVLRRGDPSWEDLLSETFERILSKLHLFEEIEGSSLASWCGTIMHHLNASTIRKEAKQREHLIAHAPLIDTCLVPNLTWKIFLEMKTHLLALPHEQQRVLYLVVGRRLPYEAAAEEEGIPIGTLRSRLSRARAALREISEGRTAGPVRSSKIGRRFRSRGKAV